MRKLLTRKEKGTYLWMAQEDTTNRGFVIALLSNGRRRPDRLELSDDTLMMMINCSGVSPSASWARRSAHFDELHVSDLVEQLVINYPEESKNVTLKGNMVKSN